MIKVGDTFEVVEWIKSPFGELSNSPGYIGLQCIKDNFGNIITPHCEIGILIDFLDSTFTKTKRIGKLTITKIK